MDDLISRQAAIACAKGALFPCDNTDDFAKATNLLQVLQQLPSAEKTGRWVLITNKYIEPQVYMCSVCGRTIKYNWHPRLLTERYPYCNCGAKMERSEE